MSSKPGVVSCLLWWILSFTKIIPTPKLEIKISKQNKFTAPAYVLQEGTSKMMQQSSGKINKQKDHSINSLSEIIQNLLAYILMNLMPTFIKQSRFFSMIIFPIARMFVGGWVNAIEQSGVISYLLTTIPSSYTKDLLQG